MVRVLNTTRTENGKTVHCAEVDHPEGEFEGITCGAGGTLFFIDAVDPFNVAYTWDPKPTDEATGLKDLREITTYHSFSYHGFFKPSIAEVLAQIPEEHLDTVVAFEIIASPDTVDDLNREHEALSAGYHVATTRLYARE
jgi:hypothetical protein